MKILSKSDVELHHKTLKIFTVRAQNATIEACEIEDLLKDYIKSKGDPDETLAQIVEKVKDIKDDMANLMIYSSWLKLF